MLKFELKYHYAQLTFKLAVLLFFVLGMICVQGGFGSPEVHKNSPYVISVITGLLSLFTVFVATLFCANVVLRDTTYRMDSLLFSTGISRTQYFVVRFTGLLLAVMVVLSAAVLGIWAGGFLTAGPRPGPFNLIYILQPLFVFGLPNVFFACSVIFTTAILTRNMRAVYVAGVLLYILYLTASILGDSPLMARSGLQLSDNDLLPLLYDPFGLAPLFGKTRYWTDAQRNTQLFPLAGPFLLNRVVWTVFAALLLGISYRFFHFRLPVKAKKRDRAPSTFTPVAYRPVSVLPHAWPAFVSQFKQEATALFKHIPFMVMLLLWIFLFAVDLKDELFRGAYGIRFFPATGIIVEALRPIRPAMLLIAFYAAELIWRERAANMQGLVYSTPVSRAAIFAAKGATLMLMVFVLVTANICIGIGMQLSMGYTQLELPLYISLYWYSAWPLCLFAVLALVIQTIIPGKFTGMLLNLLLAALIVFSRRIGIEHYLLRFATAPDLEFSAMNGAGHYGTAFNWYMLYWTAFAMMLATLTLRRRVALIFFAIFVASGSYIFYKTNIEGHYQSRVAQLAWAVNYEKQYRHSPSQPVITAINTHIDLHPSAGRYTVKGSYVLKNTTGSVMPYLQVGIDPEVTKAALSLPGTYDAVFHMYRITHALQPGDTMHLGFTLEVIRSGFMPFNNENSVVSNGSYIELEKYLPYLGYNNGYEIEDPFVRKEQGLPGNVTTASTDSSLYQVDYETIISASSDQHVVTVGDLQRSWVAGNRRYFHYKTARPVNYMLALSAARYKVLKDGAFSVYYHPEHGHNVPDILRAMKDAVAYGNQHFSPYAFQQLTLAEIPQYRGAATAYPGVVFAAGRLGFQGDYHNRINYGYSIIAHEVAHEWWANAMVPLSAPGASFLTESLAKYTEAMVLEKRYGHAYMTPYLEAERELYFGTRSGVEQPLARVESQPFVYYQKGVLVMYHLKEVLGEEKLNAVLRTLLGKGRRVAAAEFVQELKKVAPAELVEEAMYGVGIK